MTKILFINASEYSNGNTSQLGHQILTGIDYKIYQLGQHFADDQFKEFIAKMQAADVWLIGTPVYWHNMSEHLKTWFDRMSEYPQSMWYGKK